MADEEKQSGTPEHEIDHSQDTASSNASQNDESGSEYETHDEGEFTRFPELPVELQNRIWHWYFAILRQPKYTREEIVECFTDFYTWMRDHVLPDDALKLPPPEGWSNFAHDSFKDCAKSEFAIEVLKHLPYIKESDNHDDNIYNFQYKSVIRDFSTAQDASEIVKDELPELLDPIMEDLELHISAKQHVIQIATGHESGGIDLYLDTKRGTIMVDIVRMGYEGTYDLREYCARLKDEYRSLKLFKVPGNTIFEEDDDELKRDVPRVLAYSQRGVDFGSRVDRQWIRQIYRTHGWPDNFRKNEAMQEIEDFVHQREDEWSQDREEVSEAMAYGQQGIPFGSRIDVQWISQLHLADSGHQDGERDNTRQIIEEFIQRRMAEENE